MAKLDGHMAIGDWGQVNEREFPERAGREETMPRQGFRAGRIFSLVL
jgi:hypothetical protein